MPNTSLQDVMATISSTLACKGAPVTTQLTTLQATGQSATQSVPVNSGATSANITLNWGDAAPQEAQEAVEAGQSRSGAARRSRP